MIKISVNKKAAFCSKSAGELITTGDVGKEVRFDFSDDWSGYAKTVVFEGSGVAKDVFLTSDRCAIPPECIVIPGGVLRCGVYGVRGDLVTTTAYCEIGRIERGAEPSGDIAEDPTPELWQQALDAANQARESAAEVLKKLPDAINAALEQAKESGEFDGDDGKDGNDYILTDEDKSEIAEQVRKSFNTEVWTITYVDGTEEEKEVALV